MTNEDALSFPFIHSAFNAITKANCCGEEKVGDERHRDLSRALSYFILGESKNCLNLAKLNLESVRFRIRDQSA